VTQIGAAVKIVEIRASDKHTHLPRISYGSISLFGFISSLFTRACDESARGGRRETWEGCEESEDSCEDFIV